MPEPKRSDAREWIDREGGEWTEAELMDKCGWVPSIVADNLRARAERAEEALEEIARVLDVTTEPAEWGEWARDFARDHLDPAPSPELPEQGGTE